MRLRIAYLLLIVTALVASGVHAQNPQTNDVSGTQPLVSVNARFTNGIAAGFWATAGTGLTLNLSAGGAYCEGVQTYAGGTLTMTASTTNYVYLDMTNNCVPTVNTTGFTDADIPIAAAITNGSGFVVGGIVDYRSPFRQSLPLPTRAGMYLCGIGSTPYYSGCVPGTPYNDQTASTYAVQGTDRGSWVVRTVSVAASDTIAEAGISPFDDYFPFVYVDDPASTANITLTPTTSLIYCTVSSQCPSNTSLTLSPGQAAIIDSDAATPTASYHAILIEPSSGSGPTPFNPNSVTLFDDFVGGATTMALGWTSQNSCVGGGCGLQPQPQSSVAANAIGIIGVASDNSSAYQYLLLGINSTGGNQLNPQVNTFKEYWRVNNENGGASGTSRVGLSDNRGAATSADGVWFESGTAQSNTDWWCVQRSASASHSADSGVAATSGTYHTVEIDASGASTVVWKIDGNPVCAGIGGTDLPNTGLDVTAQALASGSTASDIWLDYFRLDITTTGR